MNLKKAYLLFFATTLSVIALLYGIVPNWFTHTFLSSTTYITTDAAHILRAVTGLYLTLVGWVYYSAITNKHMDATIFVTGLFCGGLGIGRLLSIIVDGVPSPLLVLYVIMEFAIVPIVYLLLNKTSNLSLKHI
ncbi:DUF4345 domain-containing protein [Flammeovirga pacifica]|uniref:DUF4345 domain-containing protein n=1 Tax=Flammeovirga pacifica TaxID=915059 RepID=A0A1S1YYT4_FLAPC|nr:DUF4345 domain-containing protein [Flammeovirga pacifica]OHX66035.1 hypothetical protein NH26_06560 [Flammeovirga pacifica]